MTPTRPDPVRVLVIRTVGTNCDRETCRGFELAGAACDLVHLHALIDDPTPIERARVIALPGGFSYGDDVASGRVQAMWMREHLLGHLRRAVDRGVPILGICNGFQVLVQLGLLPGGGGSFGQTTALTHNAGARFIDVWSDLSPAPGSRCVWTAGLEPRPYEPALAFPNGHGEGRFVAPPAALDDLEARGLVALRYAADINGSERAIAGICDESGLVFGLMPHPDRFLDWNRHPAWTRLPAEAFARETPGVRIFRNGVAAARQTASAPRV